jgi:ribosomal protein S18 acetylase RimI-like enzyme
MSPSHSLGNRLSEGAQIKNFTKIDTRPTASEDVDWLADVFLRSMREAITITRGSWDFERENAQFRAQLQIADTRVIRVEGNDVGLVTVRALDGKLLEVHTLCIQRDRQGAGVGTRIMQNVMTAARTAGSAVELSVLESNTRAERFYARLGFAKIGASAHHIRMRWPAVGRGLTQLRAFDPSPEIFGCRLLESRGVGWAKAAETGCSADLAYFRDYGPILDGCRNVAVPRTICDLTDW